MNVARERASWQHMPLTQWQKIQHHKTTLQNEQPGSNLLEEREIPGAFYKVIAQPSSKTSPLCKERLRTCPKLNRDQTESQWASLVIWNYCFPGLSSCPTPTTPLLLGTEPRVSCILPISAPPSYTPGGLWLTWLAKSPETYRWPHCLKIIFLT